MSDSYLDAPATKMLQVHCSICGRLLLDSDSIAQRIGPECRGGLELLEPDIRQIANEHVYHAAQAALEGRIEEVMHYADLVEQLDSNLKELADRMRRRFVKKIEDTQRKPEIIVEEKGKELVVKTPPAFRRGGKDVWEEFKTSWKRIDGSWWDHKAKRWHIANTQKAAVQLFGLFKRYFPGRSGVGRKGVFVVPTEQ